MKKSLIAVLASLFYSVLALAQTPADAEKHVERFNSFYEKNQADSIFNIFCDDVRNALTLTTTTQMIRQLHGQFGKIVSRKNIGSQQGIFAFKELFEKAGYALFLNFNQENKIAGIFVRPDEVTRTNETATLDNFSLQTKESKLSGTLELPEGKMPVPVVLIISGSGPTDRNSNNAAAGLQTNSFPLLADGLKKAGIASLRYDKRGVGKSSTTKGMSQIVFEDFVNDAANILKELKNDRRFSKVIVAGHSEGALVGLLALNKEGADGYISISGAGFPIDALLKTQLAANQPQLLSTSSGIIDSLKAGQNVRQETPAALAPLFHQSLRPFLSSWMKYDPASEFKKCQVPSLIIQGTSDLQVDQKNALQLAEANKKALLKLIPEMNHVLKQVSGDKSKNLESYAKPGIPLHPDLVPVITSYVKGLK